MPFCTNCGNQVSTGDLYCARCGARQADQAATPSASSDFLKNMTPRTASMLCYIPFFGWLAAILILASQRFRDHRDVRFHGFQGLYLFVVWLLVDWVVTPFLVHVPGAGFGPARAISALLQLAVFSAWIFMIIKTSQEETYRLPIVGELAERSVAEQR